LLIFDYFVSFASNNIEDGDGFYDHWVNSPSKLNISSPLEEKIRKFCQEFLPFQLRNYFCSETSTSPVEGFNSFIHGNIPKIRLSLLLLLLLHLLLLLLLLLQIGK